MTASNDPLPIEAARTPFLRKLRQGNVVVVAATGSGKSTRLPVWAAAEGPVLVVEPRRIAAASLASYIAELEAVPIGQRIGYAVRLDSRYGPDTEILFATPGIALRWLADSGLRRFATVILDEFHERRWDTDLLLALLHDAGGHRLVMTSATIDAARVADYTGAQRLESQGRAYPVEVEHLATDLRAMPTARDLAARVRRAVDRALAADAGDVLVFLPGRREIGDAESALADVDAQVLALHASVPIERQRRALRPGAGRRVILATNVAETSLTVPGVTSVVDSGLERRTQHRNGRTVLALRAIARDSAEQRKGRAGRIGPGRCLRLWGANAPLEKATPPEIEREDLTELTLAAACAGRPARELAFPDPLPKHRLIQAEATLEAFGAVDEDGRPTARGQALFALPVDTQLAHLLVAMPDAASAAFMADLIAGLSIGRRWVRAPRDSDEREALTHWLGRRCDASLLVAALRLEEVPGTRIDARGRAEAQRLANQLRELMQLAPLDATWDAAPEKVLRAAAHAAPLLAHVRRAKRRHALANGAGELIADEQSLVSEADEAVLVLDQHNVPGKGTRQTLSVGTCLAPLPLQALIEEGLAEPGLAGAQWDGERLTVERSWRYAGREIQTETVEPEGAEARAAAAQLILDGKLLAPAGERLQRDIEAWALYVQLGYADADAVVPRAQPWLEERLRELGLAHSDDLALIEPDDVRFQGIPEWERARFDETYPREVSLPDLRLRIHYDVGKRLVTAEKIEGTRRNDPQSWELPAWSGWKVRYKRASRVVEIR